MGLREEKKARLRIEIEQAAIELFRERGFDATPVRAICERVRISDATFFNYFAAKDAVLDAFARVTLRSALASDDSAPNGPLRAQIRDRVRKLSDVVASDRDFMRVVWARVRLAASGSDGPHPGVRALVREAQQRGEVRADLPAEQIGGILVAALERGIADWLRDDREPASLAPRLLGAADLVLDGSRKRNERVRAPAAAGRRPSP